MVDTISQMNRLVQFTEIFAPTDITAAPDYTRNHPGAEHQNIFSAPEHLYSTNLFEVQSTGIMAAT